jgi:pantoate--beta-alanine ligase
VRTVAEVRAAVAAARSEGRTIGLVPTMGALHAGHLALAHAARRRCFVVMSIFVNPTQFNDGADLAAYPRDEQLDAELAHDAGVDVLFVPSVEEVYPPGFSTTVSVAVVTEPLEGAHRGAAHFDGVTTVVTKLLNMVGPDVAFFGQKDAQQAVVVKRLVRDLDLPVTIEVCPTVREPDGLALSSRNARLSAEDRSRAVALSRALEAAREALAAGERSPGAVVAAARAELLREGVEPEYLELVDAPTLAPVGAIGVDAGSQELLVAVAARIGGTRLIDNALVRVRPDGGVETLESFNGQVNATGRK